MKPEIIDIESERFSEAVFELVRRTACELPDDVRTALEKARAAEEPGSTAEFTLSQYLKNIEMAKELSKPACQDTGKPNFFVRHPENLSKRKMTLVFHDVLAKATQAQFLRPNAVHPVTGKNSGINVGDGFPGTYFSEWDEPAVEIDLMLKGGGSENVGRQYSLPHGELEAGRDLEGVRRVVLDAVRKAEGKGCPPGILGICIGGDRGSGYVESKRQLLRRLDDTNPDPVLAELEQCILNDANQLGIGPLGLGGKTTLMGVKIGALHRVPASYFVTITYMCWEHRRRSLRMEPDGSYTVL